MVTNDGARISCRYTGALVAAIFAGCLATVAVAPAAVAQPLLNAHYPSTFTFRGDLCGIDVEGTSTTVQHRLVRSNPGGFELEQETVVTTTTYTNPETGLSVVDRNRLTIKDVRAIDNGDGTVTRLAQFTGLDRDVVLPQGTRVIKNVGRVLYETVYNYNGTPSFRDDDVEVSSRLVSRSGQHDPLSQEPLFMFCEEIVEGLT